MNRPDSGYITLMCDTGDCNQLGMLLNAERNIYTADATLESRIPLPNEDLVNVPLIQVACGGLHNLLSKLLVKYFPGDAMMPVR